MVEYQETFLEEMKSLLPYFVEFEEDGKILPKEYPSDCAVGGPDRRPIIMITHDESTFSADDSRRKIWTLEGHNILRPKGKGRGIMVSDFLLPWSRLNLLSLPLEQQQELASSGIPFEAATYFEYGKMEEGYWTGEHLLEQIKAKALPIAEALYPGYELLFMFDNATSHAIYAKDALQVTHMNKGPGGQQPFLRAGWYEAANGEIITQELCLLTENPTTGKSTKVQKGIQAILEERGLWPVKGVRLSCEQPKCTNCQTLSTCTVCVKGRKCEACKETKEHSGRCTKQRLCDTCDNRKSQCQCITKKYCVRCKEITQQKSCLECEKMPPKCISENRFFFIKLLLIILF